MKSEREIDKILNILKEFDQRISVLEGSKIIKTKTKKETWYKPGSTIDKIFGLLKEGFFNIPRTINQLVEELKTKDYHLKAPDLTLPLRKIVRRNILKRTKKKNDGSASKSWLYVKV